MIRIDLIEGVELPQRVSGCVHILMGPYLLQSKHIKIENGRCQWYESLPDKKVVFPVDIDQVPDIIFYFAD